MGRPKKYPYPENINAPEKAYRLCLLGLTDEELAIAFDVSENAINKWKADNPIFLEHVQKGRVDADGHVARALYHRAIGYEYEKKHITVARKTGKVVITPYTEFMPPDVAACGVWLRCRQKDKWQELKTVEHSGKDGRPLSMYLKPDLSDCTDEELEFAQSIGIKMRKKVNSKANSKVKGGNGRVKSKNGESLVPNRDVEPPEYELRR